jgi:enoyl-CoA hydratase
VKLIVLRGSGGNFSTGHDISGGARQVQPSSDPVDDYFRFRKYNLDAHLWMRNVSKPTIAMVEGWCINGGWELASSMDVIYAGESAKFIASQMEFFTQPWDLGFRQAKEMLFENRQIGAAEAVELGFVNRVFPDEDLERETYAYATRCAENSMGHLRMAKLGVNHTADIVGYTQAIETGFSDFMMRRPIIGDQMAPGKKRIINVDLAMQHARGERFGQTPASEGS